MPRKALPHPSDDRSDPQGFGILLVRFLEYLAVTKRTAATLHCRKYQIRHFIAWAAERDLTRPRDITIVHLELYQRHLHHHRKADDKPLSIASQCAALGGVVAFFHWLAKHHWILFNPASQLEFPRKGLKLPKDVLSISEAERIFGEVDLEHRLGIRDRAILETLYSTGIRRTEIAHVTLEDLDRTRGTLRIRLGKGQKERIVPIGERAIAWIDKYLAELRPALLRRGGEASRNEIFLNRSGQALSPYGLSERVRIFVQQAGFTGRGRCHLFRHTCATLMLEGGADIRYIQALLGHADLSTTDLYTKVSIQKLKAIHTATHPAETETGNAPR